MGFIIPDGTGFALGDSLTDGHILRANGSAIDGVPPPVVLGTQRDNASSTFADCTGLSVALAASAKYWIAVQGQYKVTDALGVKIGVNGPSSPSRMAMLIDIALSLGSMASSSVSAYNTSPTAASSQANTANYFAVEGLIFTGASSGTFILSYAAVTGGGGTTASILTGAYLWWQRLA